MQDSQNLKMGLSGSRDMYEFADLDQQIVQQIMSVEEDINKKVGKEIILLAYKRRD